MSPIALLLFHIAEICFCGGPIIFLIGVGTYYKFKKKKFEKIALIGLLIFCLTPIFVWTGMGIEGIPIPL